MFFQDCTACCERSPQSSLSATVDVALASDKCVYVLMTSPRVKTPPLRQLEAHGSHLLQVQASAATLYEWKMTRNTITPKVETYDKVSKSPTMQRNFFNAFLWPQRSTVSGPVECSQGDSRTAIVPDGWLVSGKCLFCLFYLKTLWNWNWRLNILYIFLH